MGVVFFVLVQVNEGFGDLVDVLDHYGVDVLIELTKLPRRILTLTHRLPQIKARILLKTRIPLRTRRLLFLHQLVRFLHQIVRLQVLESVVPIEKGLVVLVHLSLQDVDVDQ